MQNRIKIARAEHNFSQAELANKLGVSRQTINSIETGRYVPSTILALKAAIVLKMKVEELFSLDSGDGLIE